MSKSALGSHLAAPLMGGKFGVILFDTKRCRAKHHHAQLISPQCTKPIILPMSCAGGCAWARQSLKFHISSRYRAFGSGTVRKATCDFAPSDGRKAARTRPCRRACAIAPRRSVHGSNSGRRPTSRSRDPECEHVPEHEVFLTVMYRCSVEPSVPAYLSCSGHSPEHASAIFDVQAFT